LENDCCQVPLRQWRTYFCAMILVQSPLLQPHHVVLNFCNPPLPWTQSHHFRLWRLPRWTKPGEIHKLSISKHLRPNEGPMFGSHPVPWLFRRPKNITYPKKALNRSRSQNRILFLQRHLPLLQPAPCFGWIRGIVAVVVVPVTRP
jgi:hypothetical protein